MVEKRTAGRSRRSRSQKSPFISPTDKIKCVEHSSPDPSTSSSDSPEIAKKRCVKTIRKTMAISPEIDPPIRRMRDRKSERSRRHDSTSSDSDSRSSSARDFSRNPEDDNLSLNDRNTELRIRKGNLTEDLKKRKSKTIRRPHDSKHYSSGDSDHEKSANHRQRTDRSSSYDEGSAGGRFSMIDDNEIDLGLSKRVKKRRTESSSSSDSFDEKITRKNKSPLPDSGSDRHHKSSSRHKIVPSDGGRSKEASKSKNNQDDAEERSRNRKTKLARADWPKFPGNQREFGDSAVGKYRRDPDQSRDDRKWRWQHDTERQEPPTRPQSDSTSKKRGKSVKTKETSTELEHSKASPETSSEEEDRDISKNYSRSPKNYAAKSKSKKYQDRSEGERSQSSDSESSYNRNLSSKKSSIRPQVDQKFDRNRVSRTRSKSKADSENYQPVTSRKSPGSDLHRRENEESSDGEISENNNRKRRHSSASPVSKRRRNSDDVDAKMHSQSPASRFRKRNSESPASRFRKRNSESPASRFRKRNSESPSRNTCNDSIRKVNSSIFRNKRRSASIDNDRQPDRNSRQLSPKTDIGRGRDDDDRRRNYRHADYSSNRRSRSPRPRRQSPFRRDDDKFENSRRQKCRYSRSPDSVRKSNRNERMPDGRNGRETGGDGDDRQNDKSISDAKMINKEPDDWFAKKRKPVEMDPLKIKSGGAYIPPAKMKMLQEQIEDKTSAAYQRLEWEQLKKRITGKVNKINVENIREVVYELFLDNIVRAKGLLARSIIQAQAFSPAYTNVYACLVAVINSKFPQIGELIIRRLVIQFKRAFKRNDKTVATTAAKFIAHLVNQQVLHEILALEILTLLLETPTNDSVEVCIAFLKECGSKLTEVCNPGMNSIYERLRHVSNEAKLEARIGYMIDVAFAIRKDKFAAHPAVLEDLDLVDEEDQITHTVTLDDPLDPENMLNIFKFDEDYAKNEEMFEEIKKELLGENDDDEDGDSDEEDSDGEAANQQKTTVVDSTETNLLAFRRTVYLVIQSSMGFEECVHKLRKMNIAPNMEGELCSMVLDACCQQRTYERFYGLLAERLCRIKREFQQHFEAICRDTYDVVHRFDLTKLRIAARWVAHLLHTDAISWNILSHMRLNKDETTSAGRIYIKILFLELEEFLSLASLHKRINDPTMQSAFDGLFPRDDPESTKFAINFYINIGLGGLTADLQEHFKHGRKKQVAVFPSVPDAPEPSESEEEEELSEEEETEDSASEDSEEQYRRRKKEKKKEKKRKKAKKSKKHKRGRS